MSVEMNPGDTWGKCFVSGCPIFGSLGRGSEWACFCHYRADSGDFSEITHLLLHELRPLGQSAVDIRMHYGRDSWADAFKRIQKRLREANRLDMLFNADGKDTPPSPPCPPGMKPVVKMWLARIELEMETRCGEVGRPMELPGITPPTAPVIGPTHAMTHYTEIAQ
ncbi:hypothetical protein M3I54_22665 [Paraburkholderia sp. CNPSo 3274]|uniref:hypothetical protein n=1 Tax=Paraburkholderia sp. CNPSo 3274 TaxID=2940932 RepID=UPI0020B7ABA3|nr:hypothetical protein [Paraburkholderia sp. CNPSo 3274]MCP3709750.1 hypothetical protein [Paraburkholderia sp. CNPSo 3274]